VGIIDFIPLKSIVCLRMRKRVGILHKVMSFSRKYQKGPYIYCEVHMINDLDNHLDVVIYMYIYEYKYIYSYECIYVQSLRITHFELSRCVSRLLKIIGLFCRISFLL